jgi:three-Cys-motif partner protein
VVDHVFGGEHTEIKLDVMRAYLNFYCNALKNKNFETWYIDGFAGTGFRQETIQTGGILEGEPIALEERTLLGSASIALEVEPQFDHYHFIESNGPRRRTLQEMCSKAGLQNATVHDGDANDRIVNLMKSSRWIDRNTGWRQRAVVFLDPYGMGVRWQTLQCLADSGQADVWYLLNLKAIHQQMAKDASGIDESKFAALSDIFGTTNWRQEFYRSQPKQHLLFGGIDERETRVGTREDVSRYIQSRWRDIFRYVSEPLPLTVGHIDRYFELYCLSNSRSNAAIDLIKKGVRDIITKRASQGKR